MYDEEISFATSVTEFSSRPYSCSFQIADRMYIAGAHEEGYRRRVYKLNDYGLGAWITESMVFPRIESLVISNYRKIAPQHRYDRLPDLPFDFDEGRCSGHDISRALLCAADDRQNVDNDKLCYWFKWVKATFSEKVNH